MAQALRWIVTLIVGALLSASLPSGAQTPATNLTIVEVEPIEETYSGESCPPVHPWLIGRGCGFMADTVPHRDFLMRVGHVGDVATYRFAMDYFHEGAWVDAEVYEISTLSDTVTRSERPSGEYVIKVRWENARVVTDDVPIRFALDVDGDVAESDESDNGWSMDAEWTLGLPPLYANFLRFLGLPGPIPAFSEAAFLDEQGIELPRPPTWGP
ncbi:MAG: hypothetical protein ACPGQL_01145 [Thermoplasmatota archaeon]